MNNQEPQFVSAFVFEGNSKLVALNSHDFEREAREHAMQTTAEAGDKGVQIEVAIVDTYRRAVEILNGSNVTVFSKTLDERFPGWHLGEVDKPIDTQDVAEKILAAFENPDYQSLSNTPAVIEFVITNYPHTYHEELMRLIERERELNSEGNELMRYIILFNQPREDLVKSSIAETANAARKAELTDGISLEEFKAKFKQAYKEYAALGFHADFNKGDDVKFSELEEAKKAYSKLVHLTLEAIIENNFDHVIVEMYRIIIDNPFLRPHKAWFSLFFQHLQQDIIAFKFENRDWDYPIRWKLTSVVPH